MTIDSSNNAHPVSRQKSLRREQPSLLSKYSFLSAKITVNHWQLRDLIKPCSLSRSEILYTHDDTIRATDRDTDKVSTLCKLDYHPRCFNEIDGNIVSGGVVGSANSPSSSVNIANMFGDVNQNTNMGEGSNWRGLFSFFNRELQTTSTIRLGSYINNNVSVNKVANNQYNSYVCNNDMTLYNTSINNSRISVLDSVGLDFPLNHAVLSDDQKNLVVVGDCSSIYLLHPGQERLRSDTVIDTNCDSGFSTSFDSSGLHFATCFQDGTCLVYDIRNHSKGPLHQIYSTRRNTANGAFRCVKYSRGTDDLLVISEHVGRVHVIDTRDFNNHQIIMLPMNSLPARSPQPSSTSLNHLHDYNSSFDPSNSAVFAPKILNNNAVLEYEGNFNPNYTGSLGSFGNRSNYNSRSINNFNVLSALSEESPTPTSVYEETRTPSLNPGHRNSTNSMNSEFDYSDNEISGVDWYEDDNGSHIVIGCDRGLINWDIDSWSRRSFPSFSLA